MDFPDPNGIRNKNITAFQPLGMTSQSDETSVKRELERVMGIEPTLEAWEAAVLPLNYTRLGVVPRPGGRGRE